MTRISRASRSTSIDHRDRRRSTRRGSIDRSGPLQVVWVRFSGIWIRYSAILGPPSVVVRRRGSALGGIFRRSIATSIDRSIDRSIDASIDASRRRSRRAIDRSRRASVRARVRPRAPPARGSARRRGMFCAISGAAPARPVVTPRGVLYERSLIVKAIEVRARTEGEGRAMGGRARAIAANGARMRREL